ncbi:MAG TPA: carboxymuconolactone decarboxylase family protein [Kutzneria sp.]|jgi:AhpD family alkylhydroperoxidase
MLKRALRRSVNQVRHVTPVRAAAARGLVGAVYRQVERDFGMLAPPVALHSPAPTVLAAAWLMLREALVADGLSDRVTRETVAEAVSRANACPYCVAVHGATARALRRRPDERLVAWAEGRGPMSFPADRRPELAGVAVTFHYLNRMVSVFLPDSPLPAAAPAAGTAVLGRIMSGWARRRHAPGQSLDLLPDAELPADLVWAKGNPTIAAAFARAAAAFGAAGERSVPADVRALLLAELVGHDGTPPGLSRAWLTPLVAELAVADQPAGRLALLTAFAPYQVTEPDIAALHGDDRAVVELASWSAFAAARSARFRLD